MNQNTVNYYWQFNWKKFIAPYSSAKLEWYLWIILKQIGYKNIKKFSSKWKPTPALQMINNNTSLDDQTRLIDIKYLAIQEWWLDSNIFMFHIRGVINPSDEWTKSLRYMLHDCPYHYIIGHYDDSLFIPTQQHL